MKKVGGSPKCIVCSKPVYVGELVTVKEHSIHKACFKCATCKKTLMPEMCGVHENQVYCNPHFKVATGAAPPPKPAASHSTSPPPPPANTRVTTAEHPTADTTSTTTPATATSGRGSGLIGLKANINGKMTDAILNQKTTTLCQRVFAKYDEDSDGHITINDLQKMCMEMGQRLNEEELTMAMRLLDTDGSGTIEQREFEKWWRQEARFAKLQLDDSKLEFLHKAFERFLSFDANASGTLDRDEFPALHEFLLAHGYTNQPLEKAWDRLDDEALGYISFNSYVNYILYCRQVLGLEGNDESVVATPPPAAETGATTTPEGVPSEASREPAALAAAAVGKEAAAHSHSSSS
ncbi:calcium-dependent protein kinase 21 [Pelomyxa schiedti]|nr:calcium-dependent protein kinase 21 [Pelomyxa schiedti]